MDWRGLKIPRLYLDDGGHHVLAVGPAAECHHIAGPKEKL